MTKIKLHNGAEYLWCTRRLQCFAGWRWGGKAELAYAQLPLSGGNCHNLQVGKLCVWVGWVR